MTTRTHFHVYTPGQHFVKEIPFKAHKIAGFSPEPLEQHFEAVYGAAIGRLNEIELEITTGSDSRSETLMLEQLSVSNAIILHEIFFDSIGEDSGLVVSNAALAQFIDQSFGSYAKWQAEFSSIAASIKTGWVVLAWSERFNRLMNIRCDLRLQALSGAIPLLAIDMSESVFSRDFGSNRTRYIAAFINTINWLRVGERFSKTIRTPDVEADTDTDIQVSVADLKCRLDQGEDVIVLDVRHDDDRERYTSRIMETDFRDSFDVTSWASDLAKDKPVIVYCMYGFWVSMKVAEELRGYGIDARSLSGGVLSWCAMGYPSSQNEYNSA